MSRKVRRNITITPEADEYLSRPHMNASGLINDLVLAHARTGDIEAAVDKFVNDVRANRTVGLNQAADILLSGRTADELEPDNPAVMTQAEKLRLSPQDLIAKLQEIDA